MQSTSMLGVSVRHRAKGDSLQNQAYLQIKQQIISGQLAPASLIDDKALAAELKLGYTPIRQALRWLALENLVVILPRRGTIVADVNLGDLQKIFEVRRELVPAAYRLAAERAGSGELEKIDELLAASKAVIAQGGPEELLQLDRSVQKQVIDASHNEFLIEILDRLHAQAMRFWRMDRVNLPALRREMRQHRDIVAALRAHDGEQAAKAIRAIIAEFHRAQSKAL